MKQALVLFLIILALIPVVKAEEKSWYEIDGIRFRFVTNSPDDCNSGSPDEIKSPVSCGTNPIGIYMPWKIEDRFSPYFFSAPTNAAAIVVDNVKKPLFLFALELPETLMTSWSFRGGLLEFEFPTEQQLEPFCSKRGQLGQCLDDSRTSIYNDFFNASDKSFADANSNWDMSADVTTSRIFLGYTLGFFIPIGKNHRFFRFGAGLGVYYGYVIDNCSSIMSNFSGITEKQPEV